jgi:hypothetical protein
MIASRAMRTSAILSMTLLAAACGGDDGPSGTPDAEVRPDGTRPDAEPPDGDGNDSFAQAVDLPLGTVPGVSSIIQEPRDHDFYTFTAAAGTWLLLDIEANPGDDPERLDTVIRLYDSQMRMIAENDDAVPRVNTDSELITRLADGGTYYVEVFDYGEWIPDDEWEPQGGANFTYSLSGIVLDAAALNGVVLDPETGDDVASASPLELPPGQVALTLGRFRDATDVDVFSFSIGLAAPESTFYGTIMPAGSDGYGSTNTAGRVWISDAAGTTVIARIDHATGYHRLSPPLAANASYRLWVEYPSGRPVGANDFYVIKNFLNTDNDPEPAGANDTAATASPLTLSPNGSFRSGFLLATLSPGGGDTADYFSFTVNAGEAVSIACTAQSAGSGLRGARAELRNSGDTVVVGANETSAGITVRSNTAVPAGTYYVRLTATSQDATVTSNFIRCGVHAGPPTARLAAGAERRPSRP